MEVDESRTKFSLKHKNTRKADYCGQTFHSNAILEGILGDIKNDISKISTTENTTPNLSVDKCKSLRFLRQDKNLVIKSDKGHDQLLQNRTDYVKNGLEHSQDPATYKQLEGYHTNSICNKVLWDFYKEELLNKEMLDFCSPPRAAWLARLYFLKKIHKSQMIDRPIVR